jgi:hypothetical protein
VRGAVAEYRCDCCGNPFTARVADRKRGWARFCSKSCKATKQTQAGRTAPDLGWRAEYLRYADTVHPFSDEAFEP